MSDNADPRRAAAVQRLAASRALLRAQLVSPEPQGQAAGPGFDPARRLRALWRSTRRSLRGSPLASVAITALQEWWHRHPWRTAGELIAGELHAAVSPLVRRHPVATVTLAAALGLGLVAGKPWRWPLVSRQLQPLPARLGRWLFHQLGQAPAQALISSLLVMLAARQSAAAAVHEQAEVERKQMSVPSDS